MKLKELHILIIFIITFFIFLYFTPSYTGYTITDLCPDYLDEVTCIEDTNCDWDSDLQQCIELQADTEGIFQEKINTLQSLQEDPETLEILQTLDIDLPSVISALYDYDLQAQTIQQDATVNDTEKSAMILSLEMQVDDLLAELPKLLIITNKISGLPATLPFDITPEMLSEGIDASLIEEILYLQEQVEAKTDIRVFSMSTFSGNELSGTYIKKTIKAPIQEGYVLEIIPSIILTSEEELNFLGEYDIISQDPLTLSIKMSNGIALYSYAISGDIFTLIDQIQTAAIPYEVEITGPTIKVFCGDGICTEHLEDEVTCPEDCAKKIPWVIIISVVVILVLGIILTHFFRHKLKNIFRKKELLFKTESDKENLKSYIKASFNEGIEEEQIKTILLSKDWTEKQISLVIDEIKGESKPKEEEKPQEESQEE